jgi:hypothetical protein
MVAMEARGRTAASSAAVSDADSRAAEELEQQSASGGTMFGRVGARERRPLWAIFSSLFLMGFVVSTLIVHAERNRALDSVAKLARDDAQLLTATLTGKQLTTPVTGSSYDKLSKKIGKSLTKGSLVGVTVWSSQGQILFSLNESLVGTTPPEMQALIVGISQGSGGTRVLDETVQTFMPVSKTAGGPVAVVELDQPLALAEARIGGFWSMLRLAFALSLIVSLLLFGLTFVSSRSLARAPEDDERGAEEDEGIEMEAEEQADEPVTREPAPTSEERRWWEPVPTLEREPAPTSEDRLWWEKPAPTPEQDLPALQPDVDEAVDQDVDQDTDQDEDLAADTESQELLRRRRDEFKARAKEAELRVKKLEAQLQEAPSAPTSEQ